MIDLNKMSFDQIKTKFVEMEKKLEDYQSSNLKLDQEDFESFEKIYLKLKPKKKQGNNAIVVKDIDVNLKNEVVDIETAFEILSQN